MNKYSIEIIQEEHSEQLSVRLKTNEVTIFNFNLGREFDRKFIKTKELLGKLASEWCHANGTEVEVQRLTYCKDCVNEFLDR